MSYIDIWLYGIIPTFFVFSVVAYATRPAAAVSIFKLVVAAVIWPFSAALIVVVFIGSAIGGSK